MPADQTQSWAYCEDVCTEDPIAVQARQQSLEYDIPALSPATGAFLSMLAATSRVRSAVEVEEDAGGRKHAIQRDSNRRVCIEGAVRFALLC